MWGHNPTPRAKGRSLYCLAVELLSLLIASPLPTALATIFAVLLTIKYTNQRERDRQEHERRMKDKELASQERSRLRDERIAAYRKLIAATATAHTEREAVEELATAQAEISLLAGSPELEEAAKKVWLRYGATQRTAHKTMKDPDNTAADFAQILGKAEASREEFLELARKELGAPPRAEDAAPPRPRGWLSRLLLR